MTYATMASDNRFTVSLAVCISDCKAVRRVVMQVPIPIPDKLSDRPDLALIDVLAINGCNGHNASSSAANKYLICLEGHLNWDNLNMDTYAVLLCKF
jgi:hypothetical protein